MKVVGVKTHIYFKGLCENMWHFIMFRENIFHISLKNYPLNI
jgi:hypothetical protein